MCMRALQVCEPHEEEKRRKFRTLHYFFFNTLIEEVQGRQVLVNDDDCVILFVRIFIRQRPSQGSLLLGFFSGVGVISWKEVDIVLVPYMLANMKFLLRHVSRVCTVYYMIAYTAACLHLWEWLSILAFCHIFFTRFVQNRRIFYSRNNVAGSNCPVLCVFCEQYFISSSRWCSRLWRICSVRSWHWLFSRAGEICEDL